MALSDRPPFAMHRRSCAARVWSSGRGQALRRLMEAIGETANLGILNGDAVLFSEPAETHETIRAFSAGDAIGAAYFRGSARRLAHMPAPAAATPSGAMV